MSGNKTSPRQKMINMMYLVLTAMLALNVSAEILRAFFLMEQSIEKTGQNMDAKNGEIMLAFQKQMETQPDLTREYYRKAKQVKKLSEDFNLYVENLKNLLAEQTGGRELDDSGKPAELVGKDDIETHANFLINEGKGKELKDKINDTRKAMIDLLDPEDRTNILSDLVAEDYGEQSWESFHFEHSPLAAVVAMLGKLQNDNKNTTYDVLYALFKKIGGSPIPIDKIEAAIVPKSSYVMSGDKFQADIYLTAYSTRQANEVYINGERYTAEDGKINYTVPTGSVGQHEVKGEIWVREADSLRKYPFQTTYNVFKGGANISVENTKQLFIDAPNPLTITVPGVAPSNVKAELIGDGILERTGQDTYNAKVRKSGKFNIRVSAKDDFGNWNVMNEEEFRARHIPPAQVRLGSLEDGKSYPVNVIKLQRLMVANLGELMIRGFEMRVQSMDVLIVDQRNNVIGSYNNVGPALNSNLQNAIQRIKPGYRLIFSNIKVDKYKDRVFSMSITAR